MAFYRGKTSYFTKARRPKQRSTVRTTGKVAGKGFAASPAGKHRTLALNAFKLAAKARAAGNTKHYWRMVGFGKKALALSRAEIKMWKLGKALRTKSYATHRAVRTTAAFR